MHAYLALVVAFALAAPALIAAAAVPGPDRLPYGREIDPQVPKLLNFVLNEAYLAAQKNRGNLVTKPRDELIADNVILESQDLHVIQPKRRLQLTEGEELVRHRRGYNLENVRVPARYPYLPVANFNRFRRWG